MYMQVSACSTSSWSKSVNHDPSIGAVHVIGGGRLEKLGVLSIATLYLREVGSGGMPPRKVLKTTARKLNLEAFKAQKSII